jgi:hypothetical protein
MTNIITLGTLFVRAVNAIWQLVWKPTDLGLLLLLPIFS